ncbi:TetR/AcrR family transcriptional regulator [Micromonospora cathayae]|uniref:TetR/AcrR family transcriptional regulator n=1 Tax=Micromonospora cathayae TaxID=3028804 RepID=A0ABY7ZWN5_9ACTN|nr:TetR/AcrR family transcriptional regulator [Micromonospora sp. HUAS 3]WDZ87470.1 TetR/AcrR family transcriptional regulator [Micromonospora sp. HUAS 3]
MTAPSRRERLRTATVAELKDGARRLLVSGGLEAVSLRAIARDMGMTAPAIYRYFPSLEALVAALAADFYDELRETVEAARDAAGADPLDQLLAMARAFRRWGVGNRAEFTLIFGNPVPGLEEFTDACGDDDHPGARLGAVFVGPLTTLAERTGLRTPPPEFLERHLGDRLGPLRQSQGDLSLEIAYVFLSGWARIYGLVAMEVFDHLRWAVSEPQALFETELAAFVTQLTPTPDPADTTRP